MSDIGERERITQDRVVKLFHEQLGYRLLGNWEEREGNTNIEEELLNVPHYDFNWQIVYEFTKPVTLPAGTTVRVDAAWDNSTRNKYNPRPDQEVFWGEQSWDEMFSPILRGVIQLKTPIVPTPPVQVSQR